MDADRTTAETAAAELVALEVAAAELVATELAAKLFPKSFAHVRLVTKVAADLEDAPTRSARYAADRRNAR
jgi:hypothetical protein